MPDGTTLNNPSAFGSIQLSALQIGNYQTPVCKGCENDRSVDLTMSGSSGNLLKVMASNIALSTTMSILVAVDSANTITKCLGATSLGAQQACEAIGMTWATPSPAGTPYCNPTSTGIAYIQQPTIVVPTMNSMNPITVATAPANLYGICFLTGIVGGGVNPIEGIQISGNCQSGWTVYGWNTNNPPHSYDWACIQEACPALSGTPAPTPSPTPLPTCLPNGTLYEYDVNQYDNSPQVCNGSCVGGCSYVISGIACCSGVNNSVTWTTGTTLNCVNKRTDNFCSCGATLEKCFNNSDCCSNSCAGAASPIPGTCN